MWVVEKYARGKTKLTIIVVIIIMTIIRRNNSILFRGNITKYVT